MSNGAIRWCNAVCNTHIRINTTKHEIKLKWIITIFLNIKTLIFISYTNFIYLLMYRICLLRILIKILHCDWFPVTGNSWHIFIIGCLQAHRRRRESETERAWIIRVSPTLSPIECKDRQLWVEIGQRPVKNVLCRQHYLVAGHTKRRRCPQKYTFIMIHMYRKGFKWISWYTRCIHCSTNNK
jgi:hypothetical protein